MKIKTFYARTMTEALRKVKEEFGSEGLILSSKESPVGSSSWFREKPAVEVVAAIDNEVDDGLDYYTPSGTTATASPAEARGTQWGWQHSWMDDDTGGKRWRFPLPSQHADPSASLFSDAVAYELYLDLVANEFNDWLAYKLLDEAQLNLPPEERGQRTALGKAVTRVARRWIRHDADGDGLPTRKIVAFVGPTGVGKTTAAAKLAASLVLQKKKKVVLLTTDTFRIGAVEQLKTYAGLIGVPFRVVSQASDLPHAFREYDQRDYILLDTAGRGQRDLAAVQDLLQFLQSSQEIERHLVLSATTKPADMRDIVDRFGTCNPDRLLFTKLDETSTFGSIFNELVRTQKPVAYVADGQRVPEDLHAVQSDQIVDIVFNAH